MNTETKKQLIVMLDAEMIVSYKELCKTKGYNMSQRIRNFIETELKNGNKDM
jgi:hypothetical protein